MALSVALAPLLAGPDRPAPSEADVTSALPMPGDVVQPYEVNDVRFCEITPAPFTCERCLRADEQFVRILRHTPDGVLVRVYACRPFRRPYVQ